MHLEVWLVENARELSSRVAAVCEGTQLFQDVLYQLNIIVPYGLQSCLLQTLGALGVQCKKIFFTGCLF